MGHSSRSRQTSSRRIAASYVDCAPSTIQNTADRDPDFAEKLRQAEYQAEIGYMKSIQNAAKKEQYWRAAAWALERRNPEDYAPRSPDVLSVNQVKRLLLKLTEIIVSEVPAARYRKGILKRLEELIADLSSDSKAKDTQS